MSELKALPPEFALLRKIGEYIDEYFQDHVNPRVARSTDIYGFLKHKKEVRERFSTAGQFGHFLKQMHMRYGGVMQNWISYKVIDTNPNFLQWYFYPLNRNVVKHASTPVENVAQTIVDPRQLRFGKKIHKASNGLKVRSLQELHIYNSLLAEEDFAVYYERPLIAIGMERYPDFTVLNRHTDTVFYWEHFGLQEQEQYGETMVDKIGWYRRIGIHKIEDGGRFVGTIYRSEHHFVYLVSRMIELMHEVVVDSKFLRQY